MTDTPDLHLTPNSFKPSHPSMFHRIFSAVFDQPFNVIEPYYLRNLIFEKNFDLYIFDCRYNYEYNGGHIYSAVPCPSLSQIIEMFFGKKKENVIIVFHCEFSQKRAPELWMKFRDLDRSVNKEHYPELWYPDIYVLNGGYRLFREIYPECCGGYVKMEDRPLGSSPNTKAKISYCKRSTDREHGWDDSPLLPHKR
ncbi:M-phase inducer phosphatase, putative [Entamoeba invadens IP1]|uniref:M-phase inducer phosphatase, putative n=1 Tax=Entamoeba invadens IP1 TaxID=370355 RepID=UPI0002C3E58B|nr:M-phase inducer phosphatase, putative [Entamoeba invadens IP1]ELP93091.1 M-phase inducer phosphatase, putative [Entamoeba invadens IP1]|eukprot:XP_004259862.1 M-phase inducer phosphatase, putative [Entamoeba invadens IP1]